MMGVTADALMAKMKMFEKKAADDHGCLVLPMLLMLGLAGRFSALGLFVVNAVTVISLAELAPVAMQQHLLWGFLLAFLCIYGPGSWSVDHLIRKRDQ